MVLLELQEILVIPEIMAPEEQQPQVILEMPVLAVLLVIQEILESLELEVLLEVLVIRVRMVSAEQQMQVIRGPMEQLD
jgi:hypothetical protein